MECANLEAPKRDDVDVARTLSDEQDGEDLYDEITKLVDVVSPLKVLSAVVGVSDSSSDELEKDEDDTNKFAPFADDQFGAMLMKCRRDI